MLADSSQLGTDRDGQKGKHAGMIAIDPLEWPGVNMAFLAAFFGSLLLTFAAIPYGKRRPIGTPTSWGEAMLGATYAFFVMFLAFGVVPHQWIDHADKNLGWSRDKIVYGPGGILKPQSVGGWNPITLQYEAIRDIVVVVLHVIFFALIIYIWNWWQTRGQTKPGTDIETSTFGRPLVRKA
jgi:hypothetical protein